MQTYPTQQKRPWWYRPPRNEEQEKAFQSALTGILILIVLLPPVGVMVAWAFGWHWAPRGTLWITILLVAAITWFIYATATTT